MHFKLLIILVEDDKTDAVIDAARKAGARGVTVISHTHGHIHGKTLNQPKTFFGLTLETRLNMLLFLVEEHLRESILEQIIKIAAFDKHPHAGIAFQIDVEDVVGVMRQERSLFEVIKEKI